MVSADVPFAFRYIAYFTSFTATGMHTSPIILTLTQLLNIADRETHIAGMLTTRDCLNFPAIETCSIRYWTPRFHRCG